MTAIAVALGVAWVVYLLIEDPKRVALVSRFIDVGTKELRAARGTFDGKTFENRAW